MDSPRDHEPSPSLSSDASADPVDAEEAEELDSGPQAPNFVFPILLFLATVFTTLWAGAYNTRSNPRIGPLDLLLQDPRSLVRGIPYAITLLTILLTHELGHYVYSRKHRVPATFPMFIPGFPHLIGTFGAVIRMRGPILSRKALFDIGVAGPIAGFLVALPALVIGIKLSTVIHTQQAYGYQLGEPLIFQFFSWLIIGPLPQGYEVLIHPVGLAAWFGLLVTSLNLLPIGQLDGGHVAYALWGSRQRSMALAMIPILLVLGLIGWSGWFVWVALAGFLGVGHPPVQDPEAVLGRKRIWVGRCALAIFVLSFTPIPISIY